MKICYVDLNAGPREHYSVKMKCHGMGDIVAWLRNSLDNFYVHSDKESFEMLEPVDKKDRCVVLTCEEKQALIAGEPVENIIPNAESYDIFAHHNVSVHLNTENINKIQTCWAVGYLEKAHRLNKDIMFFNLDYQKPVFETEHRCFSIKIGKACPTFQFYEKEDFIFQATNHFNKFQSIEVAQICNNNNIPIIFAGPIDKGYPLLDYINNKTSFYKGEIGYEEKIELTKKARAHTLVHSVPIPFTLSGLEALSYGAPLITSRHGFWPTFIKPGVNGFLISDAEEFVNAYKGCFSIDQFDCYKYAFEYDIQKVVTSFVNVFNYLYYEKNHAKFVKHNP